VAELTSTSPEAFLRALIPESDIRRAAIDVGFIQRVRKVDPVEFLFVVVLSVCLRQGQRIAEMRRALALRTGTELVRSAFWRRFSESFEALVTWLLDALVDRAQSPPPELRGVLALFKDVVAVDGSVVVVNDELASVYPGTRKNSAKAAVKLHSKVRATTGELLDYRITPETGSELAEWHFTGADKGVLHLVDRGYSSASKWHEADSVGAFFLTRMKANYNPRVIRSNRPHRGRSRKLDGYRLRTAIRRLTRRYIDVTCEFTVTPDGAPKFTREFRVVGVYNLEERDYHLYVTNVPQSMLVDEDIDQLYRLRWEVETFFKANKSGLGLEEISSAKPHIVRTFIKAALVRSSVAMQAKIAAESALPPDRWINPMKWVQVWRSVVHYLLDGILGLMTRAVPVTWCRLARLAMDPSRARAPTRYWMQVARPARMAV